MKPPTFDDVERLQEALGTIRNTALDCLQMADQPAIPDSIHRQGLAGAMREIVRNVDAVLPREDA
jgi:hypothetical protein